MRSALGFNDPLEDGEEPYVPNRAERRAAQQQYRREAKAAAKAYEKKVAARRARRPLMQAVEAEMKQIKMTQIDESHILVEPAGTEAQDA